MENIDSLSPVPNIIENIDKENVVTNSEPDLNDHSPNAIVRLNKLLTDCQDFEDEDKAESNSESISGNSENSVIFTPSQRESSLPPNHRESSLPPNHRESSLPPPFPIPIKPDLTTHKPGSNHSSMSSLKTINPPDLVDNCEDSEKSTNSDLENSALLNFCDKLIEELQEIGK